MLSGREDWRKIKEKFGIPDAVCKWSMGERVDKWKKADAQAAAAKDFDARADALANLVKDMKIYQAALKQVKTTKFKGKTGTEQANNYKGAQQAYAHEVGEMETLHSNYQRLAKPLDELKKQLKSATTKLATIATDDGNALKTFYGQQIRNDVGLPLIQAAKKDPALKTAYDEYVKRGDTINKIVNGTDSAKVHAECVAALHDLAQALGD